jgi:hypothetical protein
MKGVVLFIATNLAILLVLSVACAFWTRSPMSTRKD